MDRRVREDASAACMHRSSICRSCAAGMDLGVLSLNAQLTADNLSQKDPMWWCCSVGLSHSRSSHPNTRAANSKLGDQVCFDLLWPCNLPYHGVQWLDSCCADSSHAQLACITVVDVIWSAGVLDIYFGPNQCHLDWGEEA
eukprot:13104067-Ditylum_brightwellii.AAC.1